MLLSVTGLTLTILYPKSSIRRNGRGGNGEGGGGGGVR